MPEDSEGNLSQEAVVAAMTRGRKLMALTVGLGLVGACVYAFWPVPESEKGVIIRISLVLVSPLLIIVLKAFVEHRVYRCPHCAELPYADWQLDEAEYVSVGRTRNRLFHIAFRGLLSTPESCGRCGEPLSDMAYAEAQRD